MDGSDEEPIPFHLTNRLGQHLLADAACEFTETGEAQFAVFRQHFEDDHGPFVGNAADQFVDQHLDPRIEVVRTGRCRLRRQERRSLRAGFETIGIVTLSFR